MTLAQGRVPQASFQAPDGGAAAVDGRLVYAIGDIHGRYDLLKQLLVQVTEDCAVRARGRTPMLIFCGDYIDRGPQSAEVIEAVLWLKENTSFDIRALKGNHEQGLLDFLARPQATGWLELGGAETLASYAVHPPEDHEGEGGLVRARNALLRKMPAAHLCLFESLELMVVLGDYAFVHAGVRPGVPLREQKEQDLLWIRQMFLEAEGPFEKIIVHGHSWLDDQPLQRPHRVGIDTGAYATGVLTAIRLDDDGAAFIQARARPAADRAGPPAAAVD